MTAFMVVFSAILNARLQILRLTLRTFTKLAGTKSIVVKIENKNPHLC